MQRLGIKITKIQIFWTLLLNGLQLRLRERNFTTNGKLLKTEKQTDMISLEIQKLLSKKKKWKKLIKKKGKVFVGSIAQTDLHFSGVFTRNREVTIK